VQRFRAVLLALGLLLTTTGLGAGILAEKTREQLDHDLTLSAASRVTALDDFAERARAVTLVASHSAAFTDFYQARGTREQRIRGEAGPESLMPSVHLALRDVNLLFSDSLAAAGFVDRSGAENAVVVRGDATPADDLAPDRTSAPFFAKAFLLPFGKVYQSAPYRSASTGEWVVSDATKVDTGPGVSPALVHFEFTVESLRLALYSQHPALRVRLVDVDTGRVVVDSTTPQDVDRPLGDPSDQSLVWVRNAADGRMRSDGGMRHVVRLAHAESSIASTWAVVVSIDERSGVWAGPASIGPVGLTLGGALLLALSFIGYARHGRAMYRAARSDELTGLQNRMAAREAADVLLTRDRQLAVVLFDLDRFKHVNDSFGHHAGDELLAVIGKRLAGVVREPDDVVARLGGDEFVVIASGVHDVEAVRVLCDRLARAISAPIEVSGLEISVGASMGIALAPEHGSDYGTLLQRADIAMYDAKAHRSGWRLFRDDMTSDEGAGLSVDLDLRRAVAAGELELHFQPSFAITTGRAKRVEALVRWRHPERGLVPPGRFIPLAESTGTIKLVTRDVLRQALDQVVAWREDGQEVVVAVNVSALDVTDPDFAALVIAALEIRGLSGSSLVIELTETALLTDSGVASDVLGRLAAAGVAIAVDDFGAGYASLLYLRRYPVSVLKLDLSLVQGLTENVTDAALVRWTIEMAHALGVTCVAEGVEDEATLQALAALGCDEAQGYYLQVPVPAADLDLAPSVASVD
jgi:diguanylate cyclase (GGDEF)-like protein